MNIDVKPTLLDAEKVHCSPKRQVLSVAPIFNNPDGVSYPLVLSAESGKTKRKYLVKVDGKTEKLSLREVN